jgi:threonine aldolase
MPDIVDLRSDLMAPRRPEVARAMQTAALQPPAMDFGEDPHERMLGEQLSAELGVEAVLLVPTCTLANQIAIRLHLPEGGRLASARSAHVVTVEARATALTGIVHETIADETGHPSPAAVGDVLAIGGSGVPTLVWLENTHMLSAGSVMPIGWQAEIAAACHAAGAAVHVDGSRLWNAAVAQDAPMSTLVAGADTTAVSLNKAIGAPVGSVLCGSRAAIEAAVGWRDVLGGGWRPLGSVAAAAVAALEGWRDRLKADVAMTRHLAATLEDRLGEGAIQPAETNLIFLARPSGDAVAFAEALARHGVRAKTMTPTRVRLAIHGGVREREVEVIAAAITAADAEQVAGSRG